ncbi:hypothetical protein FJTKL_01156 [Diaporthe vaccinii]|uniref:Uncharacterized protein n=1 Tax=Diaporthe vaccinii TaxID=105482 RepID=A0ABR4F5B8_9PEZI
MIYEENGRKWGPEGIARRKSNTDPAPPNQPPSSQHTYLCMPLLSHFVLPTSAFPSGCLTLSLAAAFQAGKEGMVCLSAYIRSEVKAKPPHPGEIQPRENCFPLSIRVRKCVDWDGVLVSSPQYIKTTENARINNNVLPCR